MTSPSVIVLMGPSGAGKTTVGQALAIALGWAFLDADDFHEATAVAAMRQGKALTDDDRGPWLRRVIDGVRAELERSGRVVVACSALKDQYRRLLSSAFPDGSLRYVFLRASSELLAERLRTRKDHFASGTLLASQLIALEEPSDQDALIVDAAEPIAAQVARISRELLGR